jgi:hypothetical protein
VDRVQSLTNADAEKMGLLPYRKTYIPTKQDYVRRWFNTRYSKPRPVKEKGKIIGYRCWCWDLSAREICNLLINSCPKKRYMIRPIEFAKYKDKPLTIHINPYVHIATMRKD